MINDFDFSFAKPEDLVAVQELLAVCELPSQDVAPHLSHFILAKHDTHLVGVIGLELLGEVGLLRSLAVSEAYRGQGLGEILYRKMVDYARQQEVKQL